MSERKEAWMRLFVLIVSGIIIYIWMYLAFIMAIFNFIYTLFKKKRNRSLAEFSNLWVTEAYTFYRYITFCSNKRPFPFNDMEKPMHPVEMKQKR